MRTGILNTIGKGGAQVFAIKEAAKMAGWRVTGSSDAFTKFEGDGLVTHSQPNGTPGNMSNEYCWFVIQDPSRRRSLCFQHGLNSVNPNPEIGLDVDYAWRIIVTVDFDEFVIAAGTTTRTPPSRLGQYMRGGGTDAAPVFSAWLHAGTMEGQVVVDDVPINGVYPLYFAAHSLNPLTYGNTGRMAIDPIDPDTISPLDPDPAVYFAYSLGETPTPAQTAAFRWWYDLRGSRQRWITQSDITYDFRHQIGNSQPGAWGEEWLYQILMSDTVDFRHVKGCSTGITFTTVTGRAYPLDTFNRATDCRIALTDNFAMPYVNGQTPTGATADRYAIIQRSLPLITNGPASKANVVMLTGQTSYLFNGPAVVVPALPPRSQITPYTPLVFNITDLTVPPESVVVGVQHATNLGDMAFEGGAFKAPYRSSTFVTRPDGTATLTLVRDGGWTSNPSISVYGVDWQGIV